MLSALIAPLMAACISQVDPSPLQWQWFPAAEPKLAPYFDDLNLYGSDCTQPGAVIPSDPVSEAAQYVKSKLAEVGLNYRLNQAYTFAAMSNVSSGQNVLNFYSMQVLANWVVFNSTDLGGTSGWVGFEANAGVPFGFDADLQSPQTNIGALAWPSYAWTNPPIYVSQVSWSQSFLDGSLIAQVGMIDSTLVIDANDYANDQYAQLMNWALVNSQVLPYSAGSLGALIQWQPCEWFYSMVSSSANNTPSGRTPWFNVDSDNWTSIAELGFISQDVLGLGKGICRVQPFWATVGGQDGGGICVNVEQQLGKESTWGFFGRFGAGDTDVTIVNGAAAQAAFGIAALGPNFTGYEHNAVDYLALGLVWTQAASGAATHLNEYAIEATYSFPFTPTLTMQPDVQIFWDPAFGNSNVNVVFQLQLTLTW